MDPDHPTSEEPFDSLTGEPARLDEGRASVLTPEGGIQSIGSFARGLGARRLELALVIGGAVVLLLALLAALQ